ncbi:MAG: hypothetical protein ACR2MP_31375 [Streptosporangiaceae bacterium]
MTGEFRPEAILELLGASSALQASATIYRDLDGAWAAYADELVGEQRETDLYEAQRWRDRCCAARKLDHVVDLPVSSAWRVR